MTRYCALLLFICVAFPAFAQEAVKPPSLVDIMTPNIVENAAEAGATEPALPEALPEAAAAPIPPLDPDKFPVLAKIKEKSKDVSYDYLGQKFNLDVWLISGPGVMQIIYTLPDNKGAIIGGNLIDADGAEISTTLQQEFIQKNPTRAEAMIANIKQAAPEVESASTENTAAADTPSQKIWGLLQNSGHVTFGGDETVPQLFAVLDPLDKHSLDLWDKLQSFITDKKLRVEVVPIAATDPKAIEFLAMVLNAPDPAQAWLDLLAGKEPTKPEGPPDVKGVLALKANLDVMQAMRLREVPLLLYRRADSESMRVVKGIPKDWAAFESELGL
jgi:hypothetical protein